MPMIMEKQLRSIRSNKGFRCFNS